MAAKEYPITLTISSMETAMTNARTPTTHAATHKTGGTDAIKLDELAAPTNITTLNASTTAHGLCPKGENTGYKTLKDDITWGYGSVNGGTAAAQLSKILFRTDTSAGWANINPILSKGEPAWESDTNVFKMGNGVDNYNSLPIINLTYGTPTTISGYRKAITVGHDYVTCDLTNFPVLVKITNDAQIGTRSRADGYDIRFALSDNTNLDYERISFSIVGNVCNAIFWVRLPTLTSLTDTTFFIKYGTETTDGENASGVWNSNYKRVYHLEESGAGATGDYKESTSNSADSTGLTNQPTQAAGVVGYGQDFDGTTSEILFESGLTISDDFTISWTSKGTGQAIIGGSQASKVIVTDTYFGIYGIFDSLTKQYTFTPLDFDPTAFNRFTLVKQSTTLYAYLNGELVGFRGVVSSTNVFFWKIGANAYWNEWFDGIIDELFISTTPMTAEWIYSESINMSSPSTFLSYGAETYY